MNGGFLFAGSVLKRITRRSRLLVQRDFPPGSKLEKSTKLYPRHNLHFSNQRTSASTLSYPKSFSPESSSGETYLNRKRLKTFFAIRDKSQFMETFEEMKAGGKADSKTCNLALKFAVHIQDKALAESLFNYMESEGVPVSKESCESFVKASLYSSDPEFRA